MRPAGDKRPQLVMVANRLPIRKVEVAGELKWATSPGGLVAALRPAMAAFDQVAWIGWDGELSDGAPQDPVVVDGMQLVPVPITPDDKELHYDGMANGTLWPLYHDLVVPAEFHRSWYEGYRRVNLRFAETVAATAGEGALVWIHDYQLQLLPGMLREMRPDLQIGFFLHIPFPPQELFVQLPWREALTRGILGSDLVGFQTSSDADNFARLAVARGLASREGRSSVLAAFGRKVQVRAFPIGIDIERYEEAAVSDEVTNAARDLRARLGQPQVVMLGVDRLDYTKGIDVRLQAFREVLAEERIRPPQISMVQVAEPSRDAVDAYISLRGRVEQLVGEINGDYGRVGFPVVHYIHQTQDFDEVLSLYRAADVMLVTPFRDGMNLVAKEYVATRYDETGVLVLSEFAGAARQLKQAVMVNPHDVEGVKNAIVTAVEMTADEARPRMRSLRRAVKKSDAKSWARSFLEAMPGYAHLISAVDNDAEAEADDSDDGITAA